MKKNTENPPKIMQTVEIKTYDYYGISAYYSVMPEAIFNALEYAFLNDIKTAVVNRELFEQMIEKYRQKNRQN